MTGRKTSVVGQEVCGHRLPIPSRAFFAEESDNLHLLIQGAH